VPAEPYKLIGNIPYYITGALFRRFLTLSHQPTSLVFLVQKEVAERIARSKKESILSLSIKAYGTPVYIKTVPAGAFSPPPQVDSAIIYIKSISRSNFASPQHEARFFELVKRGFAQKRKLLRNNLGPEGASLLTKTGISLQVRAEDTSLEDWLEVSNPI
jgi:16S rRNA (adenine1518-N6/adenine1519-N6)-dimethyltransferase